MTLKGIADFYGVNYSDVCALSFQIESGRRRRGKNHNAEAYREPLIELYLNRALDARERAKTCEETAKRIRDADVFEVVE